MDTNRQISRMMPNGESSCRGRVYVSWFSPRLAKRQHRDALINSISAGHAIVGISCSIDARNCEKCKEE